MKLHDIALIFFFTLGLAVFFLLLALNTANADLGCGFKDNFLSDPVYAQTVREHCDSLTMQVELKPTHTWRDAGSGNVSFDFSEALTIVQFAGARGIQGSALFWQNLPEWANSLTPQQKATAFFNSIGEACSRVPMDSLVLVTDVDLLDGHFRSLLGDDYLERAYAEAKAECIGVELVLNVYNRVSLSQAESYIQRARPDVFGWEGHLGSISTDELVAYANGIRGFGVGFAVTEFDQGNANSQEPALSVGRAAKTVGFPLTVWNLMPHSSQGSDPGLRATPFDSQGRLTQMGIGLFAGLGESSNPATPSQPSSRRRGQGSAQPATPSGEQCFSFFGIAFCF